MGLASPFPEPAAPPPLEGLDWASPSGRVAESGLLPVPEPSGLAPSDPSASEPASSPAGSFGPGSLDSLPPGDSLLPFASEPAEPASSGEDVESLAGSEEGCGLESSPFSFPAGLSAGLAESSFAP